MIEVVGEWLISKYIFVTGWTNTHGVASEPDAPELSYLLFHSCARRDGSQTSNVADELLSIWRFECNIIAQDGLHIIGSLYAKVAHLGRAWRTVLLRLEDNLHPESADETSIACWADVEVVAASFDSIPLHISHAYALA